MLSRHLPTLLAAAALALPSVAAARSWQGITPGASHEADVVARFGEPSTRGRLEGRTALVYKAEQAIGGTRQAQFLVSEGGVVTEINVFPATALEKDAVLGTFGKEPQKTFTDDFRSVWIYRSLGVMVFFGKDGAVEAIRYTAPDRAPAPAPTPRAATPAPAPGSAPAAPAAPGPTGPR
jgi:hypothetical protein